MSSESTHISRAAMQRLAEAFSSPHGDQIYQYLRRVCNVNDLKVSSHGSVVALSLVDAPFRPFAYLRSTNGKLILRLRWVDVPEFGQMELAKRVGGRRQFQVLCSLTTQTRMLEAVRLTHHAIQQIEG